MGDIVEVTTSDQLGLATYELSTSSLLFYLKTSEHGVIFLSETSNGYEYKININIDGYTWFESADNFDELNRKHTPDLLSQDEYKKFWMAWYSGCLQLGLVGQSPILAEQFIDCDKINFITVESSSEAHWKLLLPPKTTNHHLETSIEYPIFDSGKPVWKEASHQLPINAVIGGYENETLYIIRSELRGSLTPGKFVPSLGIGFMPWGGTSHETANFSVLCGHDYCWLSTNRNYIPMNAVVGGYSEGSLREVLYVGRVRINGHVVPGKVQPSHKVCYIAYDDREIAFEEYEILIHPSAENRTACNDHIYTLPT
ncbi:uncharacterized protein LOC126979566 [Leptidea sinapis]|uniref:uncharacterized protein LOC126979566 n=1 Tax=Leptidea sinapis TaxID=189913 RepID=UPI00212D3EE2|nr:uncharacterized protein LOC126979566 [Leptidea sinapis]